MGKKVYGNLCNRFEEGKNYTHRDIQVGDDITMYYWSDRHCYYITKVIDQKHIFVKQYHVCADHDKAGGMGHQDWLYFKTAKEEADYLKKHFPDHDYSNYRDYPEEEWVFRYGKWKSVTRWNMKKLEEEDRTPELMFDGKELEKIKKGEDVCRYYKLEPISFGVRDHYYDWTF